MTESSSTQQRGWWIAMVGALGAAAILLAWVGLSHSTSASRSSRHARDVYSEAQAPLKPGQVRIAARCRTSRVPLGRWTPVDLLQLVSGDAQVMAVAVSGEHPYHDVWRVEGEVFTPAMELARRAVGNDVTVQLGEATRVVYAENQPGESLAIFAGLRRASFNLAERASVRWMAPDTLAISTGRPSALCATRERSATDRLRETDPELVRTGSVVGYWRGTVTRSDAPAGCGEMRGSITARHDLSFEGRGYWLCSTEPEARAAAAFVRAWSPNVETPPADNPIHPWIPPGFVPSSVRAEGRRVRVDFSGRLQMARPAGPIPEGAVGYWSRGDALPPWRIRDRFGVPLMPGPPAGFQYHPAGPPAVPIPVEAPPPPTEAQ